MTLPEKGQFCNEDLDLLRNWRWDNNITGQYSEFLTSEVRVLNMNRFWKIDNVFRVGMKWYN